MRRRRRERRAFAAARADPGLALDLWSCDLVSPDGMGIVWAARLLGARVPERVTGIDLMEAVIALCAAQGFRSHLLGGLGGWMSSSAETAQEGFHHRKSRRE